MNQSPAGSFLRFFVGFTLFISISFGVTFAVQTYTKSQDEMKLHMAAAAAMFAYKE